MLRFPFIGVTKQTLFVVDLIPLLAAGSNETNP